MSDTQVDDSGYEVDGYRSFPCPLCTHVLRSASGRKKHMSVHYVFRCSVCFQRFVRVSEFESHVCPNGILTHVACAPLRRREVACKEVDCDFVAYDSMAMNRHKRTAHSWGPLRYCRYPGCTSTYATVGTRRADNLTRHVSTSH